MTDETSQASSLVATDPSPSASTSSGAPLHQASSQGEQVSPPAQIPTYNLEIERKFKEFEPRLLALENSVEAILKRADGEVYLDLAHELSELKAVVASLGGGVTGATGHDAGALFHSWWARITGQAGSARSPQNAAEQLASGGAPSPQAPPGHVASTAPAPGLAAGGAPIPLSPSPK